MDICTKRFSVKSDGFGNVVIRDRDAPYHPHVVKASDIPDAHRAAMMTEREYDRGHLRRDLPRLTRRKLRKESIMLTERRKADRQQMAEIIAALAVENGATAEIKPMGAREIWVKIEAPGGLHITVDFDGDSWQPDTHVLSWCMRGNNSQKLQLHAFGLDSVNPYHQRKATQVAEGFEALRALVAAGLINAANGSIYESLAA